MLFFHPKTLQAPALMTTYLPAYIQLADEVYAISSQNVSEIRLKELKNNFANIVKVEI